MTDLRKSPSGKLHDVVNTVFGRDGDVVATLGDYLASLVTNDSSVAGATVKDALETLGAGTDAVQEVFLGKHGNDANDGLSFENAVLTLTRAIAVATALVPATDNRIAIVCDDAGTYAGSANAIPTWCHLRAPKATFDTSVNGLVLGGGASAEVYALETTTNVTQLLLLAGAALFKAHRIEQAVAGTTSISKGSVGDAFVFVDDFYVVTTSTGISCSNGGMVLQIGKMSTASPNSFGIDVVGSCRIFGKIGAIIGAGGSDTAIRCTDAGARVTIEIDYLEVNVPWNLVLGELNLILGMRNGGAPVWAGGTLRVTQAGLVSQSQTVFFGKHGNDLDDGLSPQRAVLTYAQAIVRAAALTPATDNRIDIVCLDGGSYTVTGGAVPQWCRMLAPHATFLMSGSTIALSDDSQVVLGAIEASSGGSIFLFTGARAYAQIGHILCPSNGSTGVAGVGSGGGNVLRLGRLVVGPNSQGCGSFDETNGPNDIEIGIIELTGAANCRAINLSPGRVRGRVGNIFESGAGVGAATAILTTGASIVNLVVGSMTSFVAYNVGAGVTQFDLRVNSVSGTTSYSFDDPINVIRADGQNRRLVGYAAEVAESSVGAGGTGNIQFDKSACRSIVVTGDGATLNLNQAAAGYVGGQFFVVVTVNIGVASPGWSASGGLAIVWDGGAAPVFVTGGGNHTKVLHFYYNGSVWYGCEHVA